MKKKHIRSIWYTHIKKYKRTYCIGIAMVLLVDIMQVFSTRIIGWILDFFTQEKLPSWAGEGRGFGFLFFLFLSARIILALGRFGWRITLARQTHIAGNFLRRKIWNHALYFFFTDLHKNFSKGVLLNNSNSDVTSARSVFGFTIVGIVDVVFLGIFTLIAMAFIHLKMTCWFLIVTFFLPWIIRRINDLEIIRYRKSQDSLSDFDELAGQAVSTIRMQKLTETGGVWQKRLYNMAKSYRQKKIKAVFTTLYYSLAFDSTNMLSYAVLFVLGIPYVIEGQMSVGDFVAMRGFIFLLKDPLAGLGWVISDWQKAKTSLERLRDVFENRQDPSLTKKGISITPTKSVIEIKNLNFQYEENNRKVIDQLSFNLHQGDYLGVTGPTGSGKSTLFSIMAGLRKDFKGEVSLYGKDIGLYSHFTLRSHLGFVPQRPYLFADSVRNNIALNRNISDEQILHALRFTQIDEEILTLKHGILTELGEWGINLSGGQKQRLALARALVGRPPVLFLDDCLSAVDIPTEEKIVENIHKELSGITLIWISHRKTTLRYCNRFLELK